MPHGGSRPLTVDFHPDGRRLLVRDRESGLRVIDVATGKELARFAWAGENVNAVVISPDGRRMASGSEDGAIKLWDFATGRELRTLADQSADKSDQARVMGVTFAPDGRTVAATFGGGEVRVYEITTGTVRFRFAGHVSAALRTVFSPDGSRLVTTGATAPFWSGT